MTDANAHIYAPAKNELRSGGHSIWSYGYNARKRLISSSASLADTGAYGYDYLGRRVWRTVTGSSVTTQTNIISERTFGMHTETHKKLKGLKAQNLRDHMTDLELVLTMLGETSTKEIAQQRDARGFYENSRAAGDGGGIAGQARKGIEAQTGRKVASSQNFLGVNKRTADPQLLTKKD